MPGAEIVFGKNATTAPTVWNATYPIKAKSAPYAKIIVMKNIGSWTALSNFTSIENVADTYKTAAYGYTGDRHQLGLINGVAWLIDKSAPVGTSIIIK
jgi:hypothetical protein